MVRRRARGQMLAALFVVAGIGLAACGKDDGGEVRNLGGTGTGTGSGSATGAATGAASGSATGAATGGAACESVGNVEGAKRVEVALNEWSVVPVPTEVQAGKVVFSAKNAGQEKHELVVAKAENVAGLTVKEGKVDEDALPAGALKGEIEEFDAGKTCEGSFTLDAGNYVLFCNIVETEADGTRESHFEKGMSTTFTVKS